MSNLPIRSEVSRVVVETWATELERRLVAYFEATHSPSSAPKITVMHGPTYSRIVETQYKGTSSAVYCFVDRRNGDLLKSASWKAPAKVARGSLHDADPYRNCGCYGLAYLDSQGRLLTGYGVGELPA